MPGRKYKVDAHPKRREIQRDLAKGLPLRACSEKYGISRQALTAYRDKRLPEDLAKAEEAKDLRNAETILAEIREVMQWVRKVAEACDEYLQSAEDPDKYDLGPRAEEVLITYIDSSGEKEVKRRDSLQDLVRMVEVGLPIRVLHVASRHADPRELILKAAEKLTNQLELMAKIQGQIKEIQINVINTPAWILIKQLMVQVLHPHPEAQRNFSRGITQILEKEERDASQSK